MGHCCLCFQRVSPVLNRNIKRTVEQTWMKSRKLFLKPWWNKTNMLSATEDKRPDVDKATRDSLIRPAMCSRPFSAALLCNAQSSARPIKKRRRLAQRKAAKCCPAYTKQLNGGAPLWHITPLNLDVLIKSEKLRDRLSLYIQRISVCVCVTKDNLWHIEAGN